MRVKVCLFFILVFICTIFAHVASATEQVSQISALQRFREAPKLYVPNFVLIGKHATFKVLTKAGANVELTMDYGYREKSQKHTTKANDVGIATFEVPIVNNPDFVGKSVEVAAYVWENENEQNKIKAILQNESGTASSYNRVYIADDEAAKGVLFTPWKVLNQVIMNADYDERSGYNPVSDQMYDETTPIYVRNMRDAQDNVREIPTNFNHSNR